MDTIENLHSLHRQEEELRAQSLETINTRADLRDHFQLISEAMNMIYAFSHDHEHETDDELTLQLLCLSGKQSSENSRGCLSSAPIIIVGVDPKA